MAGSDRERWDARYGAAPSEPDRDDPRPFLVAQVPLLSALLASSAPARALDIAGGVGREAVWLARQGFDVTLVDVSGVALARAAARAARVGVPLRTSRLDLDVDSLPAGLFGLVVCFDFLSRPLLATIADVLAPGGLLVFSQPTRANLARHPHPSARFLLDDGELPALVAGLDVVRYDEGWFDDRHEARLVARRPR